MYQQVSWPLNIEQIVDETHLVKTEAPAWETEPLRAVFEEFSHQKESKVDFSTDSTLKDALIMALNNKNNKDWVSISLNSSR